MSVAKRNWTLLGLAVVLLAGCGGGKSAPKSGSGESTPDATEYLLAEEPADAKGVRELLEKAGDGDQVVVVGRIGGEESPWIDGLAAFSIVDTSLISCNEIEGDNCPTPWDYCCAAGLAEARTLVKVVDDQGRIVQASAKDLLNVEELQTVVVQGTAKRDEAGNLTLLANGIYIRP